MSKEKRNYCFTINNYTEDDVDGLVEYGIQHMKYLVFSAEVGEENHIPHLQCYAYFKSAKTITAVNKHIPRAHFIECNGTAQQNRTYIVGPYSKDGKSKPFNPTHEEYGTSSQKTASVWACFPNGTMPSQGKRSDFLKIRQMILDKKFMKEIANTYPGDYIRYHKGIHALKNGTI